jgi:SAM-dependent methyltransferase
MLASFLKSFLRRPAAARYCPVCERRVERFKPLHPTFKKQCARYGFPYLSGAETLNEDDYQCPHCGAFDRVRLIVLFLEDAIGSLPPERALRLLHVAPEIGFERWLARYPNVEHVTLNRSPGAAQMRADLCAMPEVADASFDGFICSHVLEHVRDDRAALAELYRVLQPGGWGVVLVPLFPGQVHTTDEDPAERSTVERVRRFGQEDHVRLYAKHELIARLQGAGFAVEQLGVEHFGTHSFRTGAIAEGSVLYVARKPAQPQ